MQGASERSQWNARSTAAGIICICICIDGGFFSFCQGRKAVRSPVGSISCTHAFCTVCLYVNVRRTRASSAVMQLATSTQSQFPMSRVPTPRPSICQ